VEVVELVELVSGRAAPAADLPPPSLAPTGSLAAAGDSELRFFSFGFVAATAAWKSFGPAGVAGCWCCWCSSSDLRTAARIASRSGSFRNAEAGAAEAARDARLCCAGCAGCVAGLPAFSLEVPLTVLAFEQDRGVANASGEEQGGEEGGEAREARRRRAASRGASSANSSPGWQALLELPELVLAFLWASLSFFFSRFFSRLSCSLRARISSSSSSSRSARSAESAWASADRLAASSSRWLRSRTTRSVLASSRRASVSKSTQMPWCLRQCSQRASANASVVSRPGSICSTTRMAEYQQARR